MSTSCTGYQDTHPLQVSGLDATLDPALPQVHLVWHLSNLTVTDWLLDGSTRITSEQLQSAVAVGSDSPAAGSLVPAHGTATATSSLAVTDCSSVDQLTASASGLHLSLGLNGSGAAGALSTAEADMQDSYLPAIVWLLRSACDGAPLVTEPTVAFARRGSGKASRVEVSVRAQIGGIARWIVAVAQPPWGPDGDQDPTQPVATGSVQAPGLADVSLPAALSACPEPFGADPSGSTGSSGLDGIGWTLTGGGRTYPFVAAVPLAIFAPGGPCAGAPTSVTS